MKNGLEARPLWQRHLLALLAVGITTLLAVPLHNHLDLANTAMLFLLTVALVAVKLGRRPAILTAFCSVIAFDFFLCRRIGRSRSITPNTSSPLPSCWSLPSSLPT